jgi:hypothetical protein
VRSACIVLLLRMTNRAYLRLLLLVIIIDNLSAVSSHGRRGTLNTIRIQPTAGEPWPKPQLIQTTAQRLAVYPDAFHFLINETSQRCDLLTSAFDRYYRAIFFPNTYLSYILHASSNFSANDFINQSKSNEAWKRTLSTPSLNYLFVNVQQPCDQWPSLESNESCNTLVQSTIISHLHRYIWFRYTHCQNRCFSTQCRVYLGCTTRSRNI